MCVDKTTVPALNYTTFYTKDMRPIYDSVFNASEVHLTMYNGLQCDEGVERVVCRG